MTSLAGKTILITGASSGIGRQAAIEACRSGASVILTARDETRLAETIRLVNNTNPGPGKLPPAFHILDLTAPSAIEKLVSALPELNGIVHCAGIVGPLPVKFITQADIDHMFAINYHVPVNLTSLLIRKKKLVSGSSIVFMSTIATRNPYFGGALYSGAKAALEAYSRTLSLEMNPRGIRSNCIMAGLVDTPMIENPSEQNMQEEALKRYIARYPLGIGQPEDVASAILYFLSDASKWVSGTSLIMGGE
jgi:NAD(P)-dependent dehydrogenase (short-subunit alcohol dehydrogenase family)